MEREAGAAERYRLQQQIDGDPVIISEVGFRISVERGFLGASADRIAQDRDGRLVLVELKNPDNTL